MDEWTVVTVIVVLSGLLISIATPIVKQTKVMQKLNDTMEHLTEKLSEFKDDNATEHAEIWKHNDKQDVQLQDHEKRIYVIESKER